MLGDWPQEFRDYLILDAAPPATDLGSIDLLTRRCQTFSGKRSGD